MVVLGGKIAGDIDQVIHRPAAGVARARQVQLDRTTIQIQIVVKCQRARCFPPCPDWIVPALKLRLPLIDPLPMRVCEDPIEGFDAPLMSSTAPLPTLIS